MQKAGHEGEWSNVEVLHVSKVSNKEEGKLREE